MPRQALSWRQKLPIWLDLGEDILKMPRLDSETKSTTGTGNPNAQWFTLCLVQDFGAAGLWDQTT